ncbi:MAG TPA: DUF1206 domain-containing protein [Thermoanaerobaculia bacterium]|nr:DUF1206 domain-containing protein [Thermoanaerobaculia bacterium]
MSGAPPPPPSRIGRSTREETPNRTIAGQPFGQLLLWVLGLGLVGYGVSPMVKGRYRVFRP